MEINNCVVFPLVDIRKKANGQWDLLSITETLSIPNSPNSDGFYTAPLSELPAPYHLDGSNAVPSISGMTLVSSYSPQIDEFAINYDMGIVIFNQGNKGTSKTINYYGKGSLIKQAEINYINDNAIYSNDTCPQCIAGDLTVQGNLCVEGTQFITNTESVYIKDNKLLINNGEIGSGVSGELAGIEIDRGNCLNYVFAFEEHSGIGSENQTFRIGEYNYNIDMTAITGTFCKGDIICSTNGQAVATIKSVSGSNAQLEFNKGVFQVGYCLESNIGATSTVSAICLDTSGLQAVATRMDNPCNMGIPYWNQTEFRFDTTNNMTYNSACNCTNFCTTVNANCINVSCDLNVIGGIYVNGCPFNINCINGCLLVTCNLTVCNNVDVCGVIKQNCNFVALREDCLDNTSIVMWDCTNCRIKTSPNLQFSSDYLVLYNGCATPFESFSISTDCTKKYRASMEFNGDSWTEGSYWEYLSCATECSNYNIDTAQLHLQYTQLAIYNSSLVLYGSCSNTDYNANIRAKYFKVNNVCNNYVVKRDTNCVLANSLITDDGTDVKISTTFCVNASTGNTTIVGCLDVCNGIYVAGCPLTVNINCVSGCLLITCNTTICNALNVCGISTFGDANTDYVLFNGCLCIGTDINLYCGACNLLVTDDSLCIKTNLNVNGNTLFCGTFNVCGATALGDGSDLTEIRGNICGSGYACFGNIYGTSICTNGNSCIGGAMCVCTDLTVGGISTLGNANTDCTVVRGILCLPDNSVTYPILIGTDVNLYTSASNVLKTDDCFISGNGLQTTAICSTGCSFINCNLTVCNFVTACTALFTKCIILQDSSNNCKVAIVWNCTTCTLDFNYL